MMTRIIVLLTAAFILGTISIGMCDDSASRRIVNSAFGGGYSEDAAGGQRTFSFHALQREDGITEGWYHAQARARNPRARILARIDCLHVVGNVAWLGGVIESAANPNNVGRRLFVKAVDNGEGPEADADQLGGRWEDIDCATEPDAELMPIRGGNVQIPR